MYEKTRDGHAGHGSNERADGGVRACQRAWSVARAVGHSPGKSGLQRPRRRVSKDGKWPDVAEVK